MLVYEWLRKEAGVGVEGGRTAHLVSPRLRRLERVLMYAALVALVFITAGVGAVTTAKWWRGEIVEGTLVNVVLFPGGIFGAVSLLGVLACIVAHVVATSALSAAGLSLPTYHNQLVSKYLDDLETSPRLQSALCDALVAAGASVEVARNIADGDTTLAGAHLSRQFTIDMMWRAAGYEVQN